MTFYKEAKSDKQNRFNFPKNLLELSNFEGYTGDVAICATDTHWYIRKFGDTKDAKIVLIRYMDSKGRVTCAKDLNVKSIGIYVLNNELCFEPVERNDL